MRSASSSISLSSGADGDNGRARLPFPPPVEFAPVPSSSPSWIETVSRFRSPALLQALPSQLMWRDGDGTEIYLSNCHREAILDLRRLFLGSDPVTASTSTAPLKGARPYRPTDMRLASMAAISIADKLEPVSSRSGTSERGRRERAKMQAYRSALEDSVKSLAPPTQATVARHLFIRTVLNAVSHPEIWDECGRKNGLWSTPAVKAAVMEVIRSGYRTGPRLHGDTMADAVQQLQLALKDDEESSRFAELYADEADRYNNWLARVVVFRAREELWMLDKAVRKAEEAVLSYSLPLKERVASASLVDEQRREYGQLADPSARNFANRASHSLIERFRTRAFGKMLDEAIVRAWETAKMLASNTDGRAEFLADLHSAVDQLSERVCSYYEATLERTLHDLKQRFGDAAPALQSDSDDEYAIHHEGPRRQVDEHLGFFKQCYSPQKLYFRQVPVRQWLAAFAAATAESALQLWQYDDDLVGAVAKEMRLTIGCLAMDAGLLALGMNAFWWTETQDTYEHPSMLYLDACRDGQRGSQADTGHDAQLWQSMAAELRRQMDDDLVLRLQALQRHMLRAVPTEGQAAASLKCTLGGKSSQLNASYLKRTSMLCIAMAQHVAGLYSNEAKAIELALKSLTWIGRERDDLDVSDAELRAGLVRVDRRAEGLAVGELQRGEREAEAKAKRHKRQAEDLAASTAGRLTRNSFRKAAYGQAGLRTPAPKKQKREWRYDEGMDTWVLATPAISHPGILAHRPRIDTADTARRDIVQPHTFTRVAPPASAGSGSSSIDEDESAADNTQDSDTTSDHESVLAFDILRSLRKDKSKDKDKGKRWATVRPPGTHSSGGWGQRSRPRVTSAPTSPIANTGDLSQLHAQDDQSDDELDLFRAKTPPPRRKPKPVQRYDSGRDDGTKIRSGLGRAERDGEIEGSSGTGHALHPFSRMRGLERSLSLDQMPIMSGAAFLAGRGRRSLSRSAATPSSTSNSRPSRHQAAAGVGHNADLTGAARRPPPRRWSRPGSLPVSEAEDDDDDFQPSEAASWSEDFDDDDSDSDEIGQDRQSHTARTYRLRSRTVRSDQEGSPVARDKRKRTVKRQSVSGVEVVIPAASGCSSSHRYPVLDL